MYTRGATADRAAPAREEGEGFDFSGRTPSAGRSESACRKPRAATGVRLDMLPSAVGGALRALELTFTSKGRFAPWFTHPGDRWALPAPAPGGGRESLGC